MTRIQVNNSPTTNNRQKHLDSLRGIAALLVASTHYFAAFYPYTVFGLNGEYKQHLPIEDIFHSPPFGILVAGHFAVSLFFILSGYVLSYNILGEPGQKVKILASIIKRPFRLGGLVWFSMILSAILWYFNLYSNTQVVELSHSIPWFSGFWNDELDVSQFLINLTTSSFSTGYIYNTSLWTIMFELYGSILVFLFLLLFGDFKYRLVICFILIIISYNSLYQGFWLGLTVAELVKNSYISPKVIKQKKYMYPLILAFIYFSSYPNYVTSEFIKGTIYWFLPGDNHFASGYPMLAAFLIFVIVIYNDKVKTILNKPLFQFFGQISYGLYVIHILVFGSFSSWLFLQLHDYFGYGTAFIFVGLISMPIIVVLAYLITKYVDAPAIKLSKKIGELTTSAMKKWFYMKSSG